MNTFWVHKNWKWKKENATAKYIDEHCEEAVTLTDAQATVEALQRERDTLREATKVICGHCCEPMAIPSKAILQSQLSQLQALVRALPDQLATIENVLAPMNLGTMTSGDMKVFDKTKAVVMQ